MSPKPWSLAARMSRIGESATVGVARRADELKRSGRDIVDLSAGEPDFPSPPAAVRAAQTALDEGFTKYTQSSGTPELREALAASYRERFEAPWTAADCVVTVGAKTALFELALSLFEPGVEVVLPSPCWVSFTAQIALMGATPVTVPTAREDGFRIHAEPLLDAVTTKTRAILVNSPCNPTGGMLGPEDLRALVEACAARGILLISDETYERFVYGDGEHASAAALAREYPETVVVVSSFSKTWAMTGWRIGWVFGPREVIRAVATLQTHSTSNPTSFAMAGALAALCESEDDVRRMVDEYRVRRELVIPRLNAVPGFACQPPDGAFYAFPHAAGAFRANRKDSIRLAEHLLETAGVALVPGVAFGADEHLRLSFAASRETLVEGLDRMAEALR